MKNVIFALLLLLALGVWVAYAFRKRENEPELAEDLGFTLQDLIVFSKRVVGNTLSGKEKAVDNLDLKRLRDQKKRLRKAVRHSIHGSLEDRQYVKAFLKEKISLAYNFDNETINRFIPFDMPERLNAMEKFDIALYMCEKQYGTKAFQYLVEKYGWDQLVGVYQGLKRINPEDGSIEYLEHNYVIRTDHIDRMFEEENFELTLDDKVNVLIQRVYQAYLGLGPVDQLYFQNIDGLRGGTRGIPETVAVQFEVQDYFGNMVLPPRSCDAIAVFYRGININLEFATFGDELELRRVCENIYTYNPSRQLNRKRGYIVSQFADNSRVVVVGPEFAESYGFFIRKFDSDLVDVRLLFQGHENGDLILEWMDLLSKGGVFTIYTGAQGSGKTTLMRALVSFFYGTWNIRIQDGSAFELWLRKTFYWKDSIAFRETPYITSEEGIVLQKKTDGTANLVAEAADDVQFAHAIETSGVGSLFSWTTHHANTPEDLIDAGADALVSVGLQKDSERAERYFARKLKANAHMVNNQGKRYMARFTEIIPLEAEEYPMAFLGKTELESILVEIGRTTAEYYRRRTDRKYFKHRNIFEYRGNGYVPVYPPTQGLVDKMKENLWPEDRKRLDEFIAKTKWEHPA